MSCDVGFVCDAGDIYAVASRDPPTPTSAITPYSHSLLDLGDRHQIDAICESFQQPFWCINEPQNEWLLDFTRFRDVHMRTRTARPANNDVTSQIQDSQLVQSSTASSTSSPLQATSGHTRSVAIDDETREELASIPSSNGDPNSTMVEKPTAVHDTREGSAMPTAANCQTEITPGLTDTNGRDRIALHARQKLTPGNCNVDTAVKELRHMERVFIAETKRRLSQVQESAG
ncbi:hypothetical protein F5Y14DRAFT_421542 [Nemania sp. NC0429]|nr:hypothetical protein F5Y14DRAFT_421542 [Nemania sp. NC0429]